jgi:hypothetical protein
MLDARETLLSIRDAGYLVNIVQDEAAKILTDWENFSISPLREAGARKSFSDGWKVFTQSSQSIKDFTLNLPGRNAESVTPIRFRFNSDTLPYDINVLIGPNGVGKSHTLKSLVSYWLGMDAGSQTQLHKTKHQPFDNYPNISRLILMSYSPFEDFILDLSDTKLKDKTAYRYFGFRRRSMSASGSRQSSISRNQPASDSVESMFKALDDDAAYDFLSTWTSKADTILNVLQPALRFEKLVVEINPKAELTLSLKAHVIEGCDGNKYIELTSTTHPKFLRLKENLFNVINVKAGVVFLIGNEKLDLSSGQRLFVYMDQSSSFIPHLKSNSSLYSKKFWPLSIRKQFLRHTLLLSHVRFQRIACMFIVLDNTGWRLIIRHSKPSVVTCSESHPTFSETAKSRSHSRSG